MEQAIQLFGYLILAVLGFVLPVVAILFSVFQEGLSKLAIQYEAEKSHSEENIREQFQRKERKAGIDVSAIEQSLKELKSIKKTAETKLSYLNPKKQVIRLFISLMLALLGVVATFLISHFTNYYCLYPLLVSLVAFSYAIVVLWKLIGIIIEVRKIVDVDRKDTENRTTELLIALVEEVKKTGQYYLQRVYIALDGKDIKDDSRMVTAQANGKKELELGIQNHESRMAKNVEIGFILPNSFIVEKTDYYSIYRDKDEQIVRYTVSLIHGNTHHICLPLIITPLEQGDYRVRTFIKAENIESTYKNITIKVT
ncbi:MAG: hypothetical protein KAV68_06970 [Dehalococcoidales bacterium]|nr:hypothetical protein [Dehalococcoidales bacterium]